MPVGNSDSSWLPIKSARSSTTFPYLPYFPSLALPSPLTSSPLLRLPPPSTYPLHQFLPSPTSPSSHSVPPCATFSLQRALLTFPAQWSCIVEPTSFRQRRKPTWLECGATIGRLVKQKSHSNEGGLVFRNRCKSATIRCKLLLHERSLLDWNDFIVGAIRSGSAMRLVLGEVQQQTNWSLNVFRYT